MQMVKCINKIRDGKGKIIGYTLQSSTGETKKVEKNSLKEAVRNGKIGIINMTLTSDNRLVDKDASQPLRQKLDVNDMINKAQVSGQNLIPIPTYCGAPCYLISNGDSHILLIPDNVTWLNDDELNWKPFTPYIENLHGNMQVIGGKNLRSAVAMFASCSFQSLDLYDFDTRKVTNMSYMFFGCKVPFLDLSSFYTVNVEDMVCMFSECETQYLNLSSFYTGNVKRMNHMFNSCTVPYLNLSSFSVRSVENMSGMFNECKADVKTTQRKILDELKRR